MITLTIQIDSMPWLLDALWPAAATRGAAKLTWPTMPTTVAVRADFTPA